MYTPGYFAETDLAQLDRLALEYPFATLVTVDGGEPFVSHLPILYQREDSQISVRGHWSRANPQWRHAGQATLILHGPHAYVSPSWYPDKESAARVPTWNYAVAHLSGPLEIIDDEAGLAAIVTDLTTTHEAHVGSDWRFDLARDDLRSQLRGIVGFRLRPRVVEIKFKLSQNHPGANVRSVAEQLAQGDARGAAVAALMLERLSVEAVGSGR